jgi:DHA1 family tetracycline resistance protein-like MFS transporter
MQKRTPKAPLLTIFLTVFIDMLGISIIIPVIPALFFDPGAGFFSASVSEDTRSVLYGLLIACYPVMQFFGAPLLGALSDRYGRRPILSLSLLGALIGYLLFAIAIVQQHIWLLFFSRLLPGFAGGNISIVLSAIADVSDEAGKTKNFGLVGAAFGIGFILGPTIGGVLADNTVLPWFNHAVPFFFTAMLTLLNILLVWLRFPETLQEPSETPFSLFAGFRNVVRSLSNPRLRVIFTVVLFLSLGFTFFTQFFSVLLIQKFEFSEKNIGWLYGWIGIWLALTQGLIVRRMSGRIAPVRVLSISILCLAISVGVLLIPDQSFWFYILNPLIALSQGITSPNLTTVVSGQAGAKQQGEILGINQSMQSIGAALPPLIAGYLNALNGNLPILTGSILIFAGWAVFVFIFNQKKRPE